MEFKKEDQEVLQDPNPIEFVATASGKRGRTRSPSAHRSNKRPKLNDPKQENNLLLMDQVVAPLPIVAKSPLTQTLPEKMRASPPTRPMPELPYSTVAFQAPS